VDLPSDKEMARLGTVVVNAAAVESVLASLVAILIGTDENHAHRIMGPANRAALDGMARRLYPTRLSDVLGGDLRSWLDQVDALMKTRNVHVHGAMGYMEGEEPGAGQVLSMRRDRKGEASTVVLDFEALRQWNKDCGQLLFAGAALWERMNEDCPPMTGAVTRYQHIFQRTSEVREDPDVVDPALVEFCRRALETAFDRVPLVAGDELTVTVTVAIDEGTRPFLPGLLRSLARELQAVVSHTTGTSTFSIAKNLSGLTSSASPPETPEQTIARLERALDDLRGRQADPEYAEAGVAVTAAVIRVIQSPRSLEA
jgi:hypothetical protein